MQLRTLFAPLDEAFLRLVTMLEKAPPDELTGAMNAIRRSVGVGLEVLDPQALITGLRAGGGPFAGACARQPAGADHQPRLAQNLLRRTNGGCPARPQRRHCGRPARFDAVLSVTTPGVSGSQYAQLSARHARLVAGLRRRINLLDHATAAGHYAALRGKLDRVPTSCASRSR